MEETAIQLNNMSAEIESMIFRMILMKGITALVLLIIIVYVIYKLIKYYENKDIEIKFSYKEKNKIDERKEPKL
jgi:predicted histidine transporter YuiF (NhaC family)